MESLRLLLLATIFTFQLLPLSGAGQFECSGTEGKRHRINISINSKRSESGEWTTLFSASQNASELSKNIDLDLTRAVTECHGNNFFNIQGIIKDTTQANARKGLTFHYKCSSRVAITNNGKSLQKLKLDGNGAALTTRPLMDNEIFTIRLDKKEDKGQHAFAIGITTHSPDTLDIPDHMNTLKTGTWMFYHRHLYYKSAEALQGYLKTDLRNLKIGQHIGVMRSTSGTLHFFIDGVDQGPAASNIPDTVYGAFELYGEAQQGTIIDE